MKQSMRMTMIIFVFFCFAIRLMYAQKGNGLYGDWPKKCDGGDGFACQWMGDAYQYGTVLSDPDTALAAVWYSRAIAIYRRNCASGNMSDCSSLGVMYRDGIGVSKDVTQAVALIRKGCDGGDMRGCIFLGMAYRDGNGASKDVAQAVALIRKGCDSGLMFGCVELGEIYRDGNGVSKDAAQAVALFRRACDGGYADGCLYLGDAYESGDGVPRNKSKAIELYRKACSIQDYNKACDKLIILTW